MYVSVYSYNYICTCIHRVARSTRAPVYNAYRAVILYARARARLNEKPKYTGRRVGITPIGGYLSDKQTRARARARADAGCGDSGAPDVSHAANGKMYTHIPGGTPPLCSPPRRCINCD